MQVILVGLSHFTSPTHPGIERVIRQVAAPSAGGTDFPRGGVGGRGLTGLAQWLPKRTLLIMPLTMAHRSDSQSGVLVLGDRGVRVEEHDCWFSLFNQQFDKRAFDSLPAEQLIIDKNDHENGYSVEYELYPGGFPPSASSFDDHQSSLKIIITQGYRETRAEFVEYPLRLIRYGRIPDGVRALALALTTDPDRPPTTSIRIIEWGPRFGVVQKRGVLVDCVAPVPLEIVYREFDEWLGKYQLPSSHMEQFALYSMSELVERARRGSGRRNN